MNEFSNRKELARSLAIDLQNGDLRIDGARLPWWLAKIDPIVTPTDGLLEVNLSFLVDGPVTIVSESGGRFNTFHPSLAGSTQDWARTYVHEEIQRAFPWMDL